MYIAIERIKKEPKNSYGRNIKKRNPKYFNKNHNGVYNNKEKTERTKKTLGGFWSNRKRGEGTQKNPFRFATIERGQNEPKNHKGGI